MNTLLTTLIAIMFVSTMHAQTQNEYVKTSKVFLQLLEKRENTDLIVQKIAGFSQAELEEGLTTDNEKFAFWINIYNAFIMNVLKDNPELYEDRGKFFKTDFIEIADRKLTFAEIEHGIIRRSQFEYFLGYVTNVFAPSYEKQLRVKKRNYRVHFALNCGAIDCPPVVIYDDTTLDEQFSKSTAKYLKSITDVMKEEKIVKSTPLFSWFRGDFGGKKGVKKILVEQGIIDHTDYDLQFKGYDWTLDLFNFTAL